MMSVRDFEAFKDALRRAIEGVPVGSDGSLCVRLRLRDLRCASCRERGVLVAGRQRCAS